MCYWNGGLHNAGCLPMQFAFENILRGSSIVGGLKVVGRFPARGTDIRVHHA